MNTTWEYKFVGDFAPKTIKAPTLDEAFKLIRTNSDKDLVYIQYLAY